TDLKERVTDAFPARRDHVNAQVEERMEVLDERLEAVSEEIDSLAEEMADEFHASLEALSEQRATLAAEWEQLKNASEATWTDAKEQLSDALDTLDKKLSEISDSMS